MKKWINFVVLVLFGCTISIKLVATNKKIILTSPPFNAACNGVTNDVAAFQQAIDSLNNTDTILVPGPTLVGAPGLKMLSKFNCIIMGTGPTSSILAKDSLGYYQNALMLIHTCFNLQILNLTIDANHFDITPVKLETSFSCKVTFCTVQNVKSSTNYSAAGAIVSNNCTALKIRNNKILNMIGTPVDGPRGIVAGLPNINAHDNNDTIEFNYVSNSRGTGIAYHGNWAVIQTNTVTHSGGAGIKVNNSNSCGACMGKVYVQNNFLSNVAFHGIQLNNIDSTLILKDVYLRNNKIDSTLKSGIHVYDSVANLVIENNLISNTFLSNTTNSSSEGGIYITAAGRTISIINNTITANDHVNYTGNRGCGIGVSNDVMYQAAGPQNVSITNNLIEYCKYDGCKVVSYITHHIADSVFLLCNTFNSNNSYAVWFSNYTNDTMTIQECNSTVLNQANGSNYTNVNVMNLLYNCPVNCISLSVESMEQSSAAVVLYPNPASDYFQLQVGDARTIKVLDAFGRIMIEKEFKANENDLIDVRQLVPGIYIVLIKQNDRLETSKVIVSR